MYYLSSLFTHLVKGPWRTGGWHGFFDFKWLYMINFHLFSVLCQGRYYCWHIESDFSNFKNFSISLYCTLLFSRKQNFQFFEVALSTVLCNGPVGCIMNVWGYQHRNTANTTLNIFLLFENGHEITQTRCKVCLNLTKGTTTIDFRLTSVFFINLEHLSHPTLVLLFLLWKGKCWLEVGCELFIKIIQWC